MFPFIKFNIGTYQIFIPTFYFTIVLIACLVLYFNHKRSQALFAEYFSEFNTVGFNRKNLYDLIFLLMVCSFVGARLFHIIYEHPRFYFENPMEILYFWKGGYVFFGGFFLSVLGALTFFYFFSKKHCISLFLTSADFLVPSISMSYALGRISCFFEGCCFGRFCELPWAVQLRHPTQIYAFIFEAIIFIFLLVKAKEYKKNKGQLFTLWIFFHSAGRLIMESFRADFRGSAYFGISISSWIALSLMLVSSLWLLSYHKKN
jgi:phosphatidylglycerol:prolipoprotein diacylglycerol transferase